ncbi:ribonuclease R [Candidatus Epulonipiscium fishelsonii]|uniref:Ribonuclease R n=1 Tax=Candidatus Epulonipiscium fishelsonii TaxID=77094 RepID=A0ACC8XHF6_9FIRM|nr:ribonuclease R [Epulopiscium sp. SCG-D08WGA-EpuloA1]
MDRKKIVLNLIQDSSFVSMKLKEIMATLGVPPEDKDELEKILNELVKDGKIKQNKKGRYKKIKRKREEEKTNYTGIFSSNFRGFGFVEIEEEENDIFIPINAVNGALHKDKVLCKITKQGDKNRKTEGEVIEILERNQHLVGIYKQSKTFSFVELDEPKIKEEIFIPKKYRNGAVDGHKVLIELTNPEEGKKNPQGKIIEILGHVNDPGVDILSIIYEFDLPMEFPNEVMKEVSQISEEVSEKDKQGRIDLRNIQMVTIDGEDAKDLDDAVSLEILENGIYRLGVHIADVTHYVKEKSELDKEALERGTSIYLVDRVIPMLPHKLSNGICSLNAGVDRLSLSCIMDIDIKGNVISHEILETVINIDERMSYTQVKKILMDEDEELKLRYQDFLTMFSDMEKLAAILRNKRKKRGALDFDFPEAKILLDAKGKPLEIKEYDRNVATKLIEEFMLVCNETIAEDYYWQEKPFVYRSHENPDYEKIINLNKVIKSFGHEKIKGEKIYPKDLQKVLDDIVDLPEENIISTLLLRSLKQAKYTEECIGHFGLAAKYYCHFTSPIRRYPDLQIHRIIKYNIHNKLKGHKEAEIANILTHVTKHSSARERRAEEAERETVKLKKVEFMETKVGEKFEGIINGITSWGIYVQLKNTIEGLIHVNDMWDDYYIYDADRHRFIGEDTRKIYQLGDKIKIKIIGVDTKTRTINFTIDSEEQQEDEINIY